MRNPKDIVIDGKTLETILIEHKHWLDEDCDGWESMCANLHNANLSHADLRGVNLSCADLSYAYLYDANPNNVNLRGANLNYACLNDAYLIHADLHDSFLYRAELTHAALCGADLRFVNLCDANLSNANLATADLSWANLSRTIISHTGLEEANLGNADLRKTKGDLIDFRRGKILTESVIGYKKCRDDNYSKLIINDVIVTLEIPAGAIVFSINGNKCRTNKAKVIAINDNDGNDLYRAYSMHQPMSYYVGDIFNVTNFDLSYNLECSTGIHFFMTKEEAEAYKI